MHESPEPSLEPSMVEIRDVRVARVTHHGSECHVGTKKIWIRRSQIAYGRPPRGVGICTVILFDWAARELGLLPEEPEPATPSPDAEAKQASVLRPTGSD